MGIKKMLFKENEALRREIALLKEEDKDLAARRLRRSQLRRIADAMELKVGNDGSVMEDFITVVVAEIDGADADIDAKELAERILNALLNERLLIRRRL